MKDKFESSSLSSTLKSLVDRLGELNDIQQKSIESGRGRALLRREVQRRLRDKKLEDLGL
jgi:hypothetical protein